MTTTPDLKPSDIVRRLSEALASIDSSDVLPLFRADFERTLAKLLLPILEAGQDYRGLHAERTRNWRAQNWDAAIAAVTGSGAAMDIRALKETR